MKKVIRTDRAPAAIGPYSQAVKCGQLVFCSGQIALDPDTGDTVGETAADQCRQVIKNLEAVLTEAGTGLANVVKTTVFLTDMADFAAVNEVYGVSFPVNPPARVAVGVVSLPKGVKLMVDAVAVI